MSIVLCQWHSFKTNKSASLDEDLGFIEVKQFVKLKMIKNCFSEACFICGTSY